MPGGTGTLSGFSNLSRRAILLWGAALVGLATVARLVWVLSVPTVPVSDFAMYRESANYLSEFGRLDPGFIYMPGFVALLAAVKNLGGDLLAQKLLGVFFGALGAAGLFVVTWKLVDERVGAAGGEADEVRQAAPARWQRLCPCPHAALATALYALWPAGVAMASVVGTDVPAAALIVAALAILVAFGGTRPWTAALAFGAAMGLAAWVRAVALPLSALSLGYWLALRLRIRRALALTAAGLAAALVVLSPWAIRHLRQSGALYFTDDHGGITALIGANPNSEGTYTRALNQMFKDVTGRGVLDEPHHTTDQAAYAIVREWTRFEPRYTLGMITLKAERLFDPEIRLLYWPIFRAGALVGPRAAWFTAHHGAIEAVADAFGLAVMGLTLAGSAVALVRRRWTLLALLPFQLALASTYALFFAEPRYRLPLEMLAFPFVALALGEIAAFGLAAARRSRSDLASSSRALAAALVLVVLWRIVWPAALDGGRALRAHHRWAATETAFHRGSETRDAAAPLAADAAIFPDLAHRRRAERIASARRRRRERAGSGPAGRRRGRRGRLRRGHEGCRRGRRTGSTVGRGRAVRPRARVAPADRGPPEARGRTARAGGHADRPTRRFDLAC